MWLIGWENRTECLIHPFCIRHHLIGPLQESPGKTVTTSSPLVHSPDSDAARLQIQQLRRRNLSVSTEICNTVRTCTVRKVSPRLCDTASWLPKKYISITYTSEAPDCALYLTSKQFIEEGNMQNENFLEYRCGGGPISNVTQQHSKRWYREWLYIYRLGILRAMEFGTVFQQSTPPLNCCCTL